MSAVAAVAIRPCPKPIIIFHRKSVLIDRPARPATELRIEWQLINSVI